MKRLAKRHYIGGLILVLALNMGLVVFLLNSAFAETPVTSESVKTPVTVEVANQPDSPVLVSFVGVDATNERFQKINLTVQSVSDRSIRGFVLATTDGKNNGKTTVSFFPAKPFSKGAANDEVLVIENENIKPNTKVTLFIDYVSFTDKTVWGSNERKKSESISGMVSGASFAAGEFTEIIKEQGVAGLGPILAKPLVDIDVVLPSGSENENKTWRGGFRSGYKGFVSFVKTHRGNPDFTTQLDEFRASLQRERRITKVP